MRYEPSKETGGGRITVTLDGKAATLEVPPGDRASGARFNRFGFVTPHIDGNGQDVFLDGLAYTFRP